MENEPRERFSWVAVSTVVVGSAMTAAWAAILAWGAVRTLGMLLLH
jgi:hypothetical protein